MAAGGLWCVFFPATVVHFIREMFQRLQQAFEQISVSSQTRRFSSKAELPSDFPRLVLQGQDG